MTKGLVLPKGYVVGECLGSGAQGTVHALYDKNGQVTPFVVKLVALPKAGLSKAASARQKVVADTQNNEYMHYSTSFLDFQNEYIPALPRLGVSGVPQQRGETHGTFGFCGKPCASTALAHIIDSLSTGYRFLIMERMEGNFFDMVDLLLQSSSSKIDIGPIALALLEAVAAFHKCLTVLVDIKPDNIMLKSVNSRKNDPASLAARLRWLDFALARKYHAITGPPMPEGTVGDLQGTPNYCSLHVHALTTYARRDDLFSTGLLIAELLIRLQAKIDGTYTTYESTQFPTYLPWGNERSDQAIYELKKAHVQDKNSEFYQRMPAACRTKLYRFLTMADETAFAAKPNYAGFQALVETLVVSNAKKRKTPARSTGSRRRQAVSDPHDDGKPAARPSSTTRSPAATSDRKPVPLLSSSTRARKAVVAKADDDKKLAAKETSTRTKSEAKAVPLTSATTKATRAKSDSSKKKARAVPLTTTKKAAPLKKAPRSTSTRRAPAARGTDVDDDGDDMMEVWSDEEAYLSAVEGGVEPMDIDDTLEGSFHSAASNDAPTKGPGIKLVAKNGDHKGEEFTMIKGQNDAVAVGSNPRVSKKYPAVLEFPETFGMEASHAKLELVGQRGAVHGVSVINSGSGHTVVNGKSVAKGKSATAFKGSTIVLGDTSFYVSVTGMGPEKENQS